MSRTLKTAAAVIMLAFAATGVAQARGADFCRGGFASGYYHQAQAQAQYYHTMRCYGGPKSPMWRSAD